jgi:hypothetical protein
VKKAALALTTMALLLSTGIATATHPHPQGAAPAHFSLVPAYKQCTAANSTHGAPLSFPSCRPPVPRSNFLTVGTGDSNGAAANSIGQIVYRVKAEPPEDVIATMAVTDVRCTPATDASVCIASNAQDGPDYSGQLQAVPMLRLTDHFNGPSLTEAATMVDIPFPVNAACTNTSSTSIGGRCTVSTSLNAIIPGSIKDGQRMNLELGQIQVMDSGPDGNPTTADNTVFAVEGTFVP